MQIYEYTSAIRKKWWAVLGAGLIGLLAGLAFAVFADSQYRAVSSVYLQIPLDDNPSILSQASSYMDRQSRTYAELADKPVVQKQVVEQLGLDKEVSDMIGLVSASVPEDTYTVNIAVETDSEQQSIDIANSTAAALVDYANGVEPTMGGQPIVQMALTAPAFNATSELPASALFPLGGLLLGLLLGVIIALILWNRHDDAMGWNRHDDAMELARSE